MDVQATPDRDGGEQWEGGCGASWISERKDTAGKDRVYDSIKGELSGDYWKFDLAAENVPVRWVCLSTRATIV